jgi:SAM-dependent methyltransferase
VTVKEHWNERATLGERAGTDDLIAKTLEQRELLDALPNQAGRVLEIGCGRGETACLVAEFFPNLVAIDNAPKMLLEARRLAPDVDFRVGDLFDIEGEWDTIYTQRCLINIADQERAFRTIANHLAPGGVYLSVECSQDGLDAINEARRSLNLEPIFPPYAWHRYLLDAELAKVDCLDLRECREFSSTYYFLSRVVNAALAKDEGEEPSYDAPVNKLAYDLPSHGPWSQARLWIWEKPWHPSDDPL